MREKLPAAEHSRVATVPKGRAAATGQDGGENPRLAGEGIALRTRGYGASRPFNSRGVGRTTGSAVPLAPSTARRPSPGIGR